MAGAPGTILVHEDESHTLEMVEEQAGRSIGAEFKTVIELPH